MGAYIGAMSKPRKADFRKIAAASLQLAALAVFGDRIDPDPSRFKIC
jgi:hypothetical protein